jgi:hypothetical protein
MPVHEKPTIARPTTAATWMPQNGSAAALK